MCFYGTGVLKAGVSGGEVGAPSAGDKIIRQHDVNKSDNT